LQTDAARPRAWNFGGQ